MNKDFLVYLLLLTILFAFTLLGLNSIVENKNYNLTGASLCLETVLAQVDYKIEEVMV